MSHPRTSPNPDTPPTNPPPAPPPGGVAPTPDYSTGVMIAVYPPSEQALALAIDGGVRPQDMHLTLAYYGDVGDVDADAVISVARAAAARAFDFTARISGYARFAGYGDNGDTDIWVALLDSPDVDRLRLAVMASSANTGITIDRSHGYVPHITVAYLDPDAPSPAATVELPAIDITSLSTVIGADRTDYSLTGAGEGKQITVGHWVHTPTAVGVVDGIYTKGIVPGVEATITADPGTPYARLSVHRPTDTGVWERTGEHTAVALDEVKAIPPQRRRVSTDLAEALAELSTAHSETGWDLPVDRVREVYRRGVASWPGEHKTALSAHEWALGRVDAFRFTYAGGNPIPGYRGDDDLLGATLTPPGS